MTDDILNKLIAINNEKISKVKPANIKSGVTMFGVEGTYAPVIQSKTVDPTTSQQVISPDSGYDALSSVTVNAVTSAIDQNITAR